MTRYLSRIGALCLALVLASVTPAQAQLSTSLVSCWTLNEASGSRADSVGSNTLTDNNTVTSTTGTVGNAAQFTAANSEYLSHASNASLQTGDIDFTFAGWFNITGSGGMVIVGKDTDSPGSSRDYTMYVGAGMAFYVNGGGAPGTNEADSGILSTSTWHFFVAWHDAAADTLNVQIDDGSVSTANTGGLVPQTSSAEFRIGARAYASFENYTDGLIDEVAFWKRTLSSGERTSLYNSGAGLSCATIAGGGGGGGSTPTRGRLLLGVGN